METPVAERSPRTQVREGVRHADSDDLGVGRACSCGHATGIKPSAATSGDGVGAGAAGTSGAVAAGSKGGEDETLARMAAACKTLIECLGEDPTREGLVKTPMRMAKALLAVTAGYGQAPADIVSDALFESSNEEMVVVRNIDCYSMCEHHMLPFFGKVHIGYLPAGKVVGLSKLARLTDCFAKRLQIQEQLTKQIAQAVHDCVGARGVAVTIEATHMCMTMRGVEKPGSTTVSSAYTGVFKDSRELRAEFAAKC